MVEARRFGVGGNSLLMLAKTGDRVSDLTAVFKGLGFLGDRTDGSGFVRLSVCCFNGDAALGTLALNVDSGTGGVGFPAFALDVVEGGPPYVV